MVIIGYAVLHVTRLVTHYFSYFLNNSINHMILPYAFVMLDYSLNFSKYMFDAQIVCINYAQTNAGIVIQLWYY